MENRTLVEIFKEIGDHSGKDNGGNDKGSTHTYLEIYDRLFEPFRGGANILEIGLAMGDSLKLWDMYFDSSQIIGIDISVVFPPSQYRNFVRILEGDATKPEFLMYIEPMMLDIVIEDGSHVTSDQIATFNLLKGRMRAGGYYIMEDILALDVERENYLSLHDNCEIIDMRHTGRFDNVLIVYRF